MATIPPNAESWQHDNMQPRHSIKQAHPGWSQSMPLYHIAVLTHSLYRLSLATSKSRATSRWHGPAILSPYSMKPRQNTIAIRPALPSWKFQHHLPHDDTVERRTLAAGAGVYDAQYGDLTAITTMEDATCTCYYCCYGSKVPHHHAIPWLV